MKLQVRSSGGELTVPSQKEFLVLWNRGIISPDDLVKRDGVDRWVPAGELPWIRGMTADTKVDNRRLIWITIALMILGLAGAIYLQVHHSVTAKKSGPPPGAVRAVPSNR